MDRYIFLLEIFSPLILIIFLILLTIFVDVRFILGLIICIIFYIVYLDTYFEMENMEDVEI